MSRTDVALEIFNSNFNCCQAVFCTFCEEFGLDLETALKLSTGFGGGLRDGEVCGAVSGAIMALGLKEGHNIEEDLETKAKAYDLTITFIKKFKETNNTIVCKELLGYDPSKPDENAILKEKGLFTTVCTKAVSDAVRILEELLELEK